MATPPARLLSPADRSGWMEMRRAIVCLLYIAVLCKSGSSEPHNELDAVRHEMDTLRAQLRDVQQRTDGCSCAKIGSFATGRDSLAFAKESN